jgi:hypothetical protein
VEKLNQLYVESLGKNSKFEYFAVKQSRPQKESLAKSIDYDERLPCVALIFRSRPSRMRMVGIDKLR